LEQQCMLIALYKVTMTEIFFDKLEIGRKS